MSGDRTARTKVKVRVANFSTADLSLENVHRYDSERSGEVEARIRSYVDLPHVFVAAPDQLAGVKDLLARLRATRSRSYPHALFVLGGAGTGTTGLEDPEWGLDVFRVDPGEAGTLEGQIEAYAQERFVFAPDRLKIGSGGQVPEAVDVLIVGAGVTGLYVGRRLTEEGLSFCILEQDDRVGGIWSKFANAHSQVNSSEAAYRLVEKERRVNRDHSPTREILEDIAEVAGALADHIHLNARVNRVRRVEGGYEARVSTAQGERTLRAKGAIVAINDRVGNPREITWEGEDLFRGRIVSGFSDEARDTAWEGKNVVVVGMGAFAVENARTALEAGAKQVTVVARRHGTVCPKIIDYLNFATPYDEDFLHAKKSNMRNMMLWKQLYTKSGATQPECWMGKIKHEGHTISVSDIWFIAHHLGKLKTVTGSISGMYDGGVVVDGGQRIEADIVVKCMGFHRNASAIPELCGYTETYNTNYLDKDLMYLADAYIDDDAFNSFFGSSVLEMVRFYVEVYLELFGKPDYEAVCGWEGIVKVPVEDRRWSHYIDAAMCLIRKEPRFRALADRQVAERTRNFLEAHDLATYVRENQREWIDLHSLLAGRPMKEEECLPYVFTKLVEG